MRAALLHTCGSPPALGDLDLGDGLRVRVTAAPITPLDLLCASGTSYFGVPETPYVPGVQGVGHLDDGTAVWFATTAGMQPGHGSLAEYAAVPAENVVPLPSDVDHSLIAALGLSAAAALMALTWRGNLQPGEQVIVLGGGGVVGQAGIQLARLHGARRVVAVARSESARKRATDAGADAVLTPGDDLTTALDGPADLVLDPVFGEPAAAALRTLRPGGRLVNLGSSAGETAPFDSATLRGKSLSILGYTNNSLTEAQRAEAIRTVANHVAEGRLSVAYEPVALADIAAAWSRQAAGTADRRLVVIP